MRRRDLVTSGIAGAAASVSGSRTGVAQTAAIPSGANGTSVFTDTLAEMTWYEAEAAAKAGASVLWAFGVIEEHGPHLPLGTDVYVPAALLRRIRVMLGERGHPAVILPAYYWGINQVTGGFPGSIETRPSTMIALMVDVLTSLKRKGYPRVFCVSGHGDALHNQTIFDGVSRARTEAGLDAAAIFNGALARRLGIAANDPALVSFEAAPAGPPPKFMDVHAGNPETSAMLHLHPDLVRTGVIPSLAPTDLGPDDLTEWRKGQDAARRKTPLGYLGDPASGHAERGRATFEAQSEAIVAAILKRVSAQ